MNDGLISSQLTSPRTAANAAAIKVGVLKELLVSVADFKRPSLHLPWLTSIKVSEFNQPETMNFNVNSMPSEEDCVDVKMLDIFL